MVKKEGVKNQIVFCNTVDTTDSADEDIFAPIISFKQLLLLDRDKTIIFVYEDNERLNEKKERCQIAGFKNIYPCIPGIERFGMVIKNILDVQPEFLETLTELFEWTYTGKPIRRLCRPHDRLTVLSNVSSLSAAYNLFEDDLSKKTFLDILRYRCSGDTKYLEDCMVTPQ